MKKVLLLFISLCSVLVSAQKTSFSLEADTNSILIGQQINLYLEGKIPAGADYQWPLLPDTISGLSLIEAGEIDSLIENDQLTLRQKLSISSFDSGVVHIPRLALSSGGDSAFSQGFIISVNLAEAQEGNELYDIKGPKEAPIDWLKWLYIVLGTLALIGLIFWLVKRYRNKKQAPEKAAAPSLPPGEWALQELADLEKRALWQAGKQKQYYSELIDILRHYLEREYSIKAMESTAEELISKIQPLQIGDRHFQALSKSLRLSIMVKFAKQQALEYENEEALASVKDFVLRNQQEKVKKEDEHE